MLSYLVGVAAYMEAGGPTASQRPVNQQSQARSETRAHCSRSTQPEQSVIVEFSSEALQAAKERSMADMMTEVSVQATHERAEDEGDSPAREYGDLSAPVEELSIEDRAILADLERRDHEVRTKDMAYMAAAGGLAGSFAIQYETGPDGRRYAVAADVNLDTSAAATPEQTVTKARALRTAAMSASGDASAASRANTMEAQARAEMSAARTRLEQATELEENQDVELTLPSGVIGDAELALPEVDLHIVETVETEA